MAFRADESAAAGYERAKNYLVPREFSEKDRTAGERELNRIIAECGPVVDCYPTWHPLVANHDERNPARYPGTETGYHGLDHTVCFVNGFISCPYVGGDRVIESVERLPRHHAASIYAEKINVPLYNDGTEPVLVRCEWAQPLENGYMIPKKLAVPLMLEKEVPCWKWSSVGETWETMRPYLLGQPHGNRSSLFVSQDTALALKKMFVSLTESGMFGPILSR